MISLRTYLTKLASDYFISYGSNERTKIDTSVDALIKNIKYSFGNDVLEVKTFGSYQRDTILPRKYDSKSDVDIMIIFDHNRLELQPESYRQRLIKFADAYYSNSFSKMDFPTVRVDMKHITLDLIPTKKNNFWGTHHIPDRNNQWMETNPDSFTKDLETKNKNNSSVVKPVIRLLKAWNANAGYPYESFKLEKVVAGKMFWSGNIDDDFFAVIENNMSSWDLSTQGAKDKLQVMKNAIANVKSYMKQDNDAQTKLWLHRVLPQ
jgi:predicted nucleotidyltransferase